MARKGAVVGLEVEREAVREAIVGEEAKRGLRVEIVLVSSGLA